MLTSKLRLGVETVKRRPRGAAWQALVVLTPARGGAPTVQSLSLNGAKAGTTSISGFGTRWSKVTLVPTIADNAGAEVPFSYGATLQ